MGPDKQSKSDADNTNQNNSNARDAPSADTQDATATTSDKKRYDTDLIGVSTEIVNPSNSGPYDPDLIWVGDIGTKEAPPPMLQRSSTLASSKRKPRSRNTSSKKNSKKDKLQEANKNTKEGSGSKPLSASETVPTVTTRKVRLVPPTMRNVGQPAIHYPITTADSIQKSMTSTRRERTKMRKQKKISSRKTRLRRKDSLVATKKKRGRARSKSRESKHASHKSAPSNALAVGRNNLEQAQTPPESNLAKSTTTHTIGGLPRALWTTNHGEKDSRGLANSTVDENLRHSSNDTLLSNSSNSLDTTLEILKDVNGGRTLTGWHCHPSDKFSKVCESGARVPRLTLEAAAKAEVTNKARSNLVRAKKRQSKTGRHIKPKDDEKSSAGDNTKSDHAKDTVGDKDLDEEVYEIGSNETGWFQLPAGVPEDLVETLRVQLEKALSAFSDVPNMDLTDEEIIGMATIGDPSPLGVGLEPDGDSRASNGSLSKPPTVPLRENIAYSAGGGFYGPIGSGTKGGIARFPGEAVSHKDVLPVRKISPIIDVDGKTIEGAYLPHVSAHRVFRGEQKCNPTLEEQESRDLMWVVCEEIFISNIRGTRGNGLVYNSDTVMRSGCFVPDWLLCRFRPCKTGLYRGDDSFYVWHPLYGHLQKMEPTKRTSLLRSEYTIYCACVNYIDALERMIQEEHFGLQFRKDLCAMQDMTHMLTLFMETHYMYTDTALMADADFHNLGVPNSECFHFDDSTFSGFESEAFAHSARANAHVMSELQEALNIGVEFDPKHDPEGSRTRTTMQKMFYEFVELRGARGESDSDSHTRRGTFYDLFYPSYEYVFHHGELPELTRVIVSMDLLGNMNSEDMSLETYDLYHLLSLFSKIALNPMKPRDMHIIAAEKYEESALIADVMQRMTFATLCGYYPHAVPVSFFARHQVYRWMVYTPPRLDQFCSFLSGHKRMDLSGKETIEVGHRHLIQHMFKELVYSTIDSIPGLSARLGQQTWFAEVRDLALVALNDIRRTIDDQFYGDGRRWYHYRSRDQRYQKSLEDKRINSNIKDWLGKHWMGNVSLKSIGRHQNTANKQAHLNTKQAIQEKINISRGAAQLAQWHASKPRATQKYVWQPQVQEKKADATTPSVQSLESVDTTNDDTSKVKKNKAEKPKRRTLKQQQAEKSAAEAVRCKQQMDPALYEVWTEAVETTKYDREVSQRLNSQMVGSPTQKVLYQRKGRTAVLEAADPSKPAPSSVLEMLEPNAFTQQALFIYEREKQKAQIRASRNQDDTSAAKHLSKFWDFDEARMEDISAMVCDLEPEDFKPADHFIPAIIPDVICSGLLSMLFHVLYNAGDYDTTTDAELEDLACMLTVPIAWLGRVNGPIEILKELGGVREILREIIGGRRQWMADAPILQLKLSVRKIPYPDTVYSTPKCDRIEMAQKFARHYYLQVGEQICKAAGIELLEECDEFDAQTKQEMYKEKLEQLLTRYMGPLDMAASVGAPERLHQMHAVSMIWSNNPTDARCRCQFCHDSKAISNEELYAEFQALMTSSRAGHRIFSGRILGLCNNLAVHSYLRSMQRLNRLPKQTFVEHIVERMWAASESYRDTKRFADAVYAIKESEVQFITSVVARLPRWETISFEWMTLPPLNCKWAPLQALRWARVMYETISYKRDARTVVFDMVLSYPREFILLKHLFTELNHRRSAILYPLNYETAKRQMRAAYQKFDVDPCEPLPKDIGCFAVCIAHAELKTRTCDDKNASAAAYGASSVSLCDYDGELLCDSTSKHERGAASVLMAEGRRALYNIIFGKRKSQEVALKIEAGPKTMNDIDKFFDRYKKTALRAIPLEHIVELRALGHAASCISQQLVHVNNEALLRQIVLGEKRAVTFDERAVMFYMETLRKSETKKGSSNTSSGSSTRVGLQDEHDNRNMSDDEDEEDEDDEEDNDGDTIGANLAGTATHEGRTKQKSMRVKRQETKQKTDEILTGNVRYTNASMAASQTSNEVEMLLNGAMKMYRKRVRPTQRQRANAMCSGVVEMVNLMGKILYLKGKVYMLCPHCLTPMQLRRDRYTEFGICCGLCTSLLSIASKRDPLPYLRVRCRECSDLRPLLLPRNAHRYVLLDDTQAGARKQRVVYLCDEHNRPRIGQDHSLSTISNVAPYTRQEYMSVAFGDEAGSDSMDASDGSNYMMVRMDSGSTWSRPASMSQTKTSRIFYVRNGAFMRLRVQSHRKDGKMANPSNIHVSFNPWIEMYDANKEWAKHTHALRSRTTKKAVSVAMSKNNTKERPTLGHVLIRPAQKRLGMTSAKSHRSSIKRIGEMPRFVILPGSKRATPKRRPTTASEVMSQFTANQKRIRRRAESKSRNTAAQVSSMSRAARARHEDTFGDGWSFAPPHADACEMPEYSRDIYSEASRAHVSTQQLLKRSGFNALYNKALESESVAPMQNSDQGQPTKAPWRAPASRVAYLNSIRAPPEVQEIHSDAILCNMLKI